MKILQLVADEGLINFSHDGSEDLAGEPNCVTSKTPRDSVMDFFSIHALGHAMQAVGWDLTKEVNMLVEIAECPDYKTKDRLAAREELRKLMVQLLSMHGVVQDYRLVRDTPDGPVRGEITGSRFSETESLLSEYAESEKIVNALPSKENADAKRQEEDFDEVRGAFNRRPEDARNFDPRRAALYEHTESGPDESQVEDRTIYYRRGAGSAQLEEDAERCLGDLRDLRPFVLQLGSADDVGTESGAQGPDPSEISGDDD